MPSETIKRAQIFARDFGGSEPLPFSAKQQYLKLDAGRETTKEIWRRASELTIPSLFPEQGFNDSNELVQANQSLGARAVNTLSSKLTTTMLPPNAAFFKLAASERDLTLLQQTNPESLITLQKNILKATDTINRAVENSNARPTLFNSQRLRIVGGNDLWFIPDSMEMRVINPNNFVVQRDGTGNFIKFIVREMLDITSIEDPDIAELARQTKPDQSKDSNDRELYTVVNKLGPNKWVMFQEIGETVVPSSIREVSRFDDLPFLPPGFWNLLDGENYGRSHVEEYFGDLRSFDALSRLMVRGNAALAKLTYLLSPSSTIDYDELIESESGAIITGLPGELEVVQSGAKAADFNSVAGMMADLNRRISEAFLMTSAVQRDAERVTALEFASLAKELDQASGGMFTNQSRNWQLPFLKRVMRILEKRGALPKNLSQNLNLQIITGIEALGRGQELNKLQNAIQLSLAVPGGEATLKPLNIVQTIWEKVQVDSTNLIKTEEEMLEGQNQEQLSALAGEVAKPVAAEVSKNIN